MADVKISALPAAGSSLDAHEFAVNESGTSKKVTTTQIIANVMADVAAGYQPLDADLTGLAGLGDGYAQRVSGTWTARAKATAANVWAGTSDVVVTADIADSANTPVTISFNATQTLDFHTFFNGKITVSAATQLQAPSNLSAGDFRTITFIGSSGTPRAITFVSAYKNPPTITDVTSTKEYTLTFYSPDGTRLIVGSVGYTA